MVRPLGVGIAGTDRCRRQVKVHRFEQRAHVLVRGLTQMDGPTVPVGELVSVPHRDNGFLEDPVPVLFGDQPKEHVTGASGVFAQA